jgi:hypothetical protein
MSMITSGELPVLVMFLLLLYWLWRVRVGRGRRRIMTEAAALTLIQRTLPPVWADLWTGRETTRAFWVCSFAKPHTFFLDAAGMVDIAPGLAGLVPLIERNGEAILGWLPDGRFVQFYYEDGKKGDAAIEVLGRNYQEFVLSLLLELEESAMRDELIEFAATLQFAHTAELVAILDREIAGENDEALSAFRERVARNP